jgi:hypothetical protein
MGSPNMQQGGMGMQPPMGMGMGMQPQMGMPSNAVGNVGGMMMQQGYGYQNNPAMMRSAVMNMNYQAMQGMPGQMRFIPGPYGTQMGLAQGMYGDMMGMPMMPAQKGKRRA